MAHHLQTVPIAVVGIAVILLGVVEASTHHHSHHHSIQKRGVPLHQSYSLHGQIAAGNAALDEISANNQLARRSASSAIASAVGNDYSNRLSNTAQYVAMFTAPVTKGQAGRVYDTIANQQKAADISSALASNSYAISRAASDAAESNYDQAYQAETLGYNNRVRGGSGGGYGGGGSSYGVY